MLLYLIHSLLDKTTDKCSILYHRLGNCLVAEIFMGYIFDIRMAIKKSLMSKLSQSTVVAALLSSLLLNCVKSLISPCAHVSDY